MAAAARQNNSSQNKVKLRTELNALKIYTRTPQLGKPVQVNPPSTPLLPTALALITLQHAIT